MVTLLERVKWHSFYLWRRGNTVAKTFSIRDLAMPKTLALKTWWSGFRISSDMRIQLDSSLPVLLHEIPGMGKSLQANWQGSMSEMIQIEIVKQPQSS